MVENPVIGNYYVYENDEDPIGEQIVELLEVQNTMALVEFQSQLRNGWVELDSLRDDPEFIVHDAYLNGWAEETIGTTQYGSGHYVFEEVNGKYYALQTISTGATYLHEYENKAQWDVAQAAVLAEYNELEDEDGELII